MAKTHSQELQNKLDVGVGLIGAGFMGRCHANAFRSVGGLFDLPVNPVAEYLADVTEESAAKNATQLGFKKSTGNWTELINDPAVEIVSVTAPNVFHEPIVMAAVAAGKTIYCEKPLSTTAESALIMTEAVENAGVVNLVGFNFLRNPLIALTRQIILSGEIGEITGFRGRHAENYMASAQTPHSFRTDVSGGGAVADIGSHIISLARFLIGPITEVCANSETIHKKRPKSAGSNEQAPVLVDDMTHSLIAFESGVSGSIEANWAATGRTMDLSFEITGTNGAIVFSQERMNELLVWNGSASGGAGFRKIESGPGHPPYGNFCPAPGHHLGFNDLKVIEVAELLKAHAGQGACFPDFREAYEVQKTIEAMQASSKERQWVSVQNQ